MDFEAVSVVIASLVGSTGIASLITGGIQISRAARVKKAAHDMSALHALHEPGTPEFEATKFALKVLTLDLVALRLVRVGARAWWKVFGVVLTVLVFFLTMAEYWDQVVRAMDALSLRSVLLLAGSYILMFVGGFLFLFTRRRERLVAHMLEDDEFLQASVLMESPPLQTFRHRQESKKRNRRRMRAMLKALVPKRQKSR